MDSKKPRHSVASKVAIIASALAFVCLVGVVSLNFIAKPISADTYVKPFDSSPQTAVKVDQSTTQPAVAETTNGCDKTKEVPIAINNYTDPNSPSNKQLLDTKTRLKVTSAPEFLRCTNVCVPATDASTANQDVAKWIRANRPTIASELSKWKVGGSPLNVIPNYIDIDKVATKEALAQTVVTQAIKPLCEGDSSREYATLTDAQGKSVTPFKANDGYAKYEEQLNKDREAAKAAKAKAEQEAAAAKAKASTAAPQTAAPAANPQIALAASNTVTIKMTGKAFLSEEDKINGKIPDIGIRIMAALGSSYKTALNYKCAFDVTGLKEGKYILSLTMDKTFYEVNIKPDAQDAKIYIFLWNDNWTRESYFVFDYNKRKQYGADETYNLIKIKMPELTLKDKIDGRWANFVTKTNVSSQTECKDQSNAGQVKSESKTTPSVSSANNNDLE